MKKTSRRELLLGATAGLGGFALTHIGCRTESVTDVETEGSEAFPVPDPIKAFCVDFNWLFEEQEGWPNSFAKPGVWADADPAEHVAWYKGLGANVIQTFAVSCNGYAWYKGGKVPPQPGLQHDFLTDVVRLGHEEGLMVMGYYCVGSNTRWGMENPSLSYGTPSTQHIPFTDEYLDFLTASMEEAIALTGMDGFMIDWVWNPSKNLRKNGWIDAEKDLYKQLMGKPFPASGSPSEDELLAYERTAIDRCWARIHEATKAARPDCILWLSIGDPSRPEIAGSNMLKEVDWAMNENANTELFAAAKANQGAGKRLLQCLVGWEDHDAKAYFQQLEDQKRDLYGFAIPTETSLPLPIEEYLSRPIESFTGDSRIDANNRNIAALARYYNGLDLDAVVPKGS